MVTAFVPLVIFYFNLTFGETHFGFYDTIMRVMQPMVLANGYDGECRVT